VLISGKNTFETASELKASVHACKKQNGKRTFLFDRQGKSLDFI